MSPPLPAAADGRKRPWRACAGAVSVGLSGSRPRIRIRIRNCRTLP